MKWADMHGAAQFSERHALLRVGVELLARPLHNSQLARQAARLTPLARPITGSFGLLGGIEEFDVLTPRLPRRTRRAAKHAGCTDGVEEFAVGARVAAQQRVPAGFVVGKGGGTVFGFHHNPRFAKG